MDSLTALTFNHAIFWPALINGITTAGLYGLIAVSMVLSYRISRTVAFVHGGIVLSGTLLFWYLCSPNLSTGSALLEGSGQSTSRPELPMWPTIIGLMLAGAAVAATYGFLVTSTKLALYPKVTLTNFSLAMMLVMIGILFKYNKSSGEPAPTPFGNKKFHIGIETVTMHQVMTLVILVAVVVSFTVLMQRTRFGIYVRAIADNVEASKLVGVPIGQVGTSVYAISGAISALGGILLGNYVGTDTTSILFIFLRALIVCVLGAFSSIPLALAGAVTLAILDSMLKSDVFGTVDVGLREVIVVVILFSVVILIDRFGKKGSSVLAH
ncbi:MAG TPA: branched-chain amino acid ABC transporter permease [Sporichthyaceae bacterium]|jgi:branched-subunit amino acid ABC-type transport system permease component|nr:branched-chain amino acid ABC transporter permease [Sporichthyaceae bacterium]